MNLFRNETKRSVLFIIVYGVLCVLPASIFGQTQKFKNIKSINVGAKHEAMVKVMFTSPKEEYFYSTFKNVKIKKVNGLKVEAKIRKSDSVCVELVIKTNNAKQAKKLLKQAEREFGTPENKVYSNATTYDWVWNEKKYTGYIESKAWHVVDENIVVFKIILIAQ